MKQKYGNSWQAAAAKLGGYLAVSILCGVIIFFAFFCLAALVLCKVDLPLQYLVPVVSVIACAAVLTAAFVMARMAGRRGLLYGLFLGILLFLLLWGAAALQGSGILSQLAIFKALMMTLSGAVGGYLGTLSAEKKQKRKQRI